MNDHKNITNLPTTIHKELYEYIENNPQATTETVKHIFPFLPDTLLSEASRCKMPLIGYTHPPPHNIHQPQQPQNIEYSSPSTKIITWNVASLNTSLPSLHTLINQMEPAILIIQETKLTAKKSPKYIQQNFPQYKLIFNNTHNHTTYRPQQGTPYTPPRGGLLTFIHNKHTCPGNITKIPTTPNITPYLQIIKITNLPLPPIIILNIYMPTHQEDVALIQIIQNNITQQTLRNPNSHIILGGDFNRDIALIGRTHNLTAIPPHRMDLEWREYIDSLQFQYIETNTEYTRQGGQNYMDTSLIDGFYIKSPTNLRCTSETNKDFIQNSDHFPVTLNIPAS
jgi:exonuclease III